MNKYSEHNKCGTVNPLDRGFHPKAFCLRCGVTYSYLAGKSKTYEEYLKSIGVAKKN